MIVSLLPIEKSHLFSPTTALIDMGLNPLKLTELRDNLSSFFNETLPDTFLFHNNTAELIANYFIERRLYRYRDWLYSVEWIERPFPLLPSTLPLTHGVWVIFSDGADLSHALIAKLNSYGFHCVEVKFGASFKNTESNKFVIRPDFLEDYTQLFRSNVFAEGIAGVVYLWGLFHQLADEPSLSELNSLHELSCGGLLNLVKALSLRSTTALPKLVVCSWSLQEEGYAMALAQGPMSGSG